MLFAIEVSAKRLRCTSLLLISGELRMISMNCLCYKKREHLMNVRENSFSLSSDFMLLIAVNAG
jgi:hypothetical protein